MKELQRLYRSKINGYISVLEFDELKKKLDK